MKTKLKLHPIGTRVLFSRHVAPSYTETTDNGRKIIKRDFEHINLDKPRVGVITGAKYKFAGTVNPQSSYTSYEGESDYDPGYLAVEKTILLYTVRLGMLNPEILVMPNDLQVYTNQKEKIPTKFIPGTPYYPEEFRAQLREEVKNMKRDEKGRFVKTYLETVTPIIPSSIINSIKVNT